MYRYGARCDSVRLPHMSVFAPAFKEIRINEDQTVEEKEIPSNLPLPDGFAFDLEHLIKAKVPIDKVPTKIIQGEFGDFLNFANGEDAGEPEETSVFDGNIA